MVILNLKEKLGLEPLWAGSREPVWTAMKGSVRRMLRQKLRRG